MSRDGGCQCGSVRYRVNEEGLLAACHCTECQQQSGSAFGLSLIVSREAFELTQGELACFTRDADFGGVVDCFFCPRCGNRIYHLPSSMPANLNLKAGTLDDAPTLEPALHVFVRTKQPWLVIPDGVPTYETIRPR